MMRKRIAVTLALILMSSVFYLALGCSKSSKEVKFSGDDYGIDLFSSIDNLARLQNEVMSEQQSSYSRNGNNIDGFGMDTNVTGEYNDATPAIKTILELDSPGVVYRMWFTSFAATPEIRIYLDGSPNPVVNMDMSTLTSGTVSPFLKPLVADKTDSSGGFVCYVPIAFSKSIKIIGNSINYYNINYQIYPEDKEIETFTMDLDVDAAIAILENVTSDPKYKSDNKYTKGTSKVDAGASAEIANISGRKSISQITLNISDINTWMLDRTIVKDTGKTLSANAYIQFDISVDSSQQNYLYFRVPVLGYYQLAELYFDGVKAPSNLQINPRHANRIEWKASDYWSDEYFAIPLSSTTGKNKVTVKLVSVSGNDTTPISVYHIWSRAGGKNTDQIDIGDNSSQSAHSYSESGNISSSTRSYEYDPNKLISSSNWTKIYTQEEILNNLYIKITYDNQFQPAVYAPVSSFFGFGAYGAFETKGLMVGLKADGTMYCYYPMPFESKATITLENKNPAAVSDIKWTVAYKDNQFTAGEYGYFKTSFTENIYGTDSELQYGEPMKFLQTEGSGHVVGVTHSIDGRYGGVTRFYLEGDEQIYIDGKTSHSFHGTGTEDFYNGGWYFDNGVRVNPLYGCSTHNYKNDSANSISSSGRDRTVMIRTLVTDPIIFRNGIDFRMEHGGWNERTDCNAYVVTYYYHNETAATEQTDSVNLSDGSDIAAHNYTKGAESTSKVLSGAKYEGIYMGLTEPDFTLMEIKDYSEFTISINANNNGVFLRRLLSLKILEQKADVYVDGAKVGRWNLRFRNAHANFVREDDYFIPKKYTEGKSQITVKLINTTAGSENIINWTEGKYTVFCLK